MSRETRDIITRARALAASGEAREGLLLLDKELLRIIKNLESSEAGLLARHAALIAWEQGDHLAAIESLFLSYFFVQDPRTAYSAAQIAAERDERIRAEIFWEIAKRAAESLKDSELTQLMSVDPTRPPNDR